MAKIITRKVRNLLLALISFLATSLASAFLFLNTLILKACVPQSQTTQPTTNSPITPATTTTTPNGTTTTPIGGATPTGGSQTPTSQNPGGFNSGTAPVGTDGGTYGSPNDDDDGDDDDDGFIPTDDDDDDGTTPPDDDDDDGTTPPDDDDPPAAAGTIEKATLQLLFGDDFQEMATDSFYGLLTAEAGGGTFHFNTTITNFPSLKAQIEAMDEALLDKYADAIFCLWEDAHPATAETDPIPTTIDCNAYFP